MTEQRPALIQPGDWPAVCPACLHPLDVALDGAFHCADHGAFAFANGIWRFLTDQQAQRYTRFLTEYQAIRRAEGRGVADASYYRALPFEDRSGVAPEQWRIRAAGYRAFVRHVIRPLESVLGRPLRVLDLGTGNGWLAYRLAGRGHAVAAVDLGDDPLDGLAAHAWYADGNHATFASIQADFDHLPLGDACADLVIFNASLHYSTDITKSLAEATRVLRPRGRVVVLDSPVYRAAESGERMVRDREAFFQRQHGFPSNALPSENYFTGERLAEVAAGVGLEWQVFRPWRGVHWALRPWLARVRGAREPSSFWLLSGGRTTRAEDAAPSRKRGLLPAAWRVLLRLRYRLLQQPRQLGRVREIVAGRTLDIPPGVFNPRLFRTGEYLARFVGAGVVPHGAAVLDLGTGSGAVALAAAARACRVVAVDVNPAAAACAASNARLNGLAHRIDVRLGDLFEPLRSAERFDLVLFNPPFYRGAPRDAVDAAWRSVDVPERFAAGLAARLTTAGRALVVLSTDSDVDGWLRPCRACGLRVQPVARRDLINEVLLLYRIAPPSSAAVRRRSPLSAANVPSEAVTSRPIVPLTVAASAPS